MDRASCLQQVSDLLLAASDAAPRPPPPASAAARLRPLLRGLVVRLDVAAEAAAVPAPCGGGGGGGGGGGDDAPSVADAHARVLEAARAGARPRLLVACREGANAGRPVDGLGGGGGNGSGGAGAARGGDSSRGFFSFPPASLTLLHDRVAGARALEELLVHELSHARDLLVHGLDLATCGGLACSEVRAAKRAECADRWEALGARRRCARGLAETSTRMVFGAADGAACVSAVLDACYEGPAPPRELVVAQAGGALA
jgi:hypothetical protein